MTNTRTTPHPALAGSLPDGRSFVDVMRVVSGRDMYVNADHLIVSPNVRVELVEPEASTQKLIDPRTQIAHTNAGPKRTPWEALVAYWRRHDINGEAHFQVPQLGQVIQAMPLNRKADCNYKANDFAISYETEDDGYPTLDRTPWTLDQLGNMIGAMFVVCVTYGAPCSIPPRWNAGGIGYHVLYPEWSSYTGKTCPGAARIRQYPWLLQAVANKLAEFGDVTGWRCGDRGFVRR